MAQDHSIKGTRYYDCDICGMTYRITDTVLNSAGLRVCREHDIDKGEYRFAPSQSYNTNAPVYYDRKADRYYQLQTTSGVLNSVEIGHLGGFIPLKYTVLDKDRNIPYLLFFQYGQVHVKERVEGRRTPLLIDTQTGAKRQLFVKVLTSGYLSGVIVPMTSGEVGLSMVEVS